jgi:hypothetical protein
MRATFWGVQSFANKQLMQYIDTPCIRLTLAGIIGGIAQTCVDAPIEYLKTQQIGAKGKASYSDIIREMIQNGGIRGFKATLYRNVPFAGSFKMISSIDQLGWLGTTGQCGLAGFVSSVLTQPWDVYKTRIQSTNNIPEAIIKAQYIKDIKKNPIVMFRGVMPRSILGFCTMGVGGFIYEYVIHFRI